MNNGATTPVALLNAPSRDAMATDILDALSHHTAQARGELLNFQFTTYHEYAAAFAKYNHAASTEKLIKLIAKKHLED